MSTKDEIDVTYGVDNDFFRLWLDESMAYTCALFQTGDETLEQAQLLKHEHHHRAARVRPESRVLDIGCGWGANLEYLTVHKGVREAVGITLSQDQYQSILERKIPNATVKLVDYRDYAPEKKFDAVISIGMFEHVATPQQTQRGEHIGIYREYFRRAWEWTRPGAWFSLQSVIGARIPRGTALKEIAWTTTHIFPGAISPRPEAIFAAASPYWEVMELHTRRDHYARTTAEWLLRLEKNKDTICQRFGEQVFIDYQRYLRACVMAFEDGYQSLAQFALRRLDD